MMDFTILRALRSPAPKPRTRLIIAVLLVTGVLATLALTPRPVQAATFIVDTVSDAPLTACDPGIPNDCSLRGAITAANGLAGADTINFAIPGAGPFIISLGSDLPAITETLTIDGSTQPGANCANWPPALLVVVDGAGAGTSAIAFFTSADGVTIRGLVISRFGGGAIQLSSSNNSVTCNFIGADPTGTIGAANTTGISVGGGNNQIGGPSVTDGNLISGNNTGITLFGSGNTIQRNFIGTSVFGNSAIANGTGVLISTGDNNTISNNVISGNSQNGIHISGSTIFVTRIIGNIIGANASGSGAVPNGANGIQIDSGAQSNFIGQSGGENIIAFNGGSGVLVLDSVGNRINYNRIFSNGGRGINLGNTATPPANDPGDSDSGPNELQNYPVITSATAASGTITISGTLNSTSGGLFDLLFFANSSCDSSGFGEGETYLGQTTVTADEIGDASFTGVTVPEAPGQLFITAVAIDVELLHTSEFSACFPLAGATIPPTPVVLPPPPVDVDIFPTTQTIGNGDITYIDVNFRNRFCGPMRNVVIRVGASPEFVILGASSTSGTSSVSCTLASNTVESIQPGDTVTFRVQVQANADITTPIDVTNVVAIDFDLPPESSCNARSGAYLRTRAQQLRIMPRTLPRTGYVPTATESGANTLLIVLGLTGGAVTVAGMVFGLVRRRRWSRRAGRYLRGFLLLAAIGTMSLIFSPSSFDAPVAAQTATCPPFVRQALDAATDQCGALGRNKACYGNFQIDAEAQPNAVSFKFDSVGDAVDLGALRSLRTSPYDPEKNTWGIALLRVQASLPNSAQNQNVSMIVFGNTSITNTAGSDAQPLQAFTFQTGSAGNICTRVPSSGLILQSPKNGPKVKMVANGVQLTFGSTIFLQSQPGQSLIVSTLEGEAEVGAADVTQTARAGTRVRVPMGDDLSPAGPPAPPESYSLEVMPVTAIGYLPEGITPAQPIANPECLR